MPAQWPLIAPALLPCPSLTPCLPCSLPAAILPFLVHICTAWLAVCLTGVVGNKRELKVFERSKLLPFAIGIKDRRRPDETDW